MVCCFRVSHASSQLEATLHNGLSRAFEDISRSSKAGIHWLEPSQAEIAVLKLMMSQSARCFDILVLGA